MANAGPTKRDLKSSRKRKSQGTHRVHGGGAMDGLGSRIPSRTETRRGLPRFIYWVLYQISFDKEGSKSENHCFRGAHRGFRQCNS